MNYKQNERLNQLTGTALIIGVDIAKEFHVARAQDIRGVELGKSIKFNKAQISDCSVFISHTKHRANSLQESRRFECFSLRASL